MVPADKHPASSALTFSLVYWIEYWSFIMSYIVADADEHHAKNSLDKETNNKKK